MHMISSNPSFVNRDVRSQGQVVESENEGKDVESGPHNEEIEEVPRFVGDTVYAIPSFPQSMYTNLRRVSYRYAEDLTREHISYPELQAADASGVV